LRKTSSPRIFVSDCEGPISKNDNAYELTSHFVPEGDKLFALISKYDDVLSDVFKRPGYKAGNTLKLILPFLMAYGVTNEKMKDFSAKNVLLVPGAKDTLKFLSCRMPSFIVSTSYEHYIRVLCHLTNFPFENTYCTRVDVDKYSISEEEKRLLKKLREEIVAMPMIEIPEGANSIKDFSPVDQKTIKRLDEIFWKEIPKMKCGKVLWDVNPVGGEEKANATLEAADKVGGELRNVMYVGDSITDVQAFQLVRKNGGLTVSFNGNEYAVREAEIAVMSENTVITSILAEVFNRLGKEAVLELAEEWGPSALEKFSVAPTLRDKILELPHNKFPKVEIITSDNRERLEKESSVFRRKVRGEAIGRLG